MQQRMIRVVLTAMVLVATFLVGMLILAISGFIRIDDRCPTCRYD